MKGFRIMMALAGWLLAAPAVPAGSGDVCGDTCLREITAAFLDGYAANRPERAQLGADVAYTENGQRLWIGDGAWGTLSGLVPERLVLTDPSAGRVAVLTGAEETNTTSLAHLLLTVRGRKVVAIDATFLRDVNTDLARDFIAGLNDTADVEAARHHAAGPVQDLHGLPDGRRLTLAGDCELLEIGRFSFSGDYQRRGQQVRPCGELLGLAERHLADKVELVSMIEANGLALAVTWLHFDGADSVPSQWSTPTTVRFIDYPVTLINVLALRQGEMGIERLLRFDQQLPYGSTP